MTRYKCPLDKSTYASKSKVKEHLRRDHHKSPAQVEALIPQIVAVGVGLAVLSSALPMIGRL